jgi:hypothetical protein
MESETEKITKLIESVKEGIIPITNAEAQIKELIVKGRNINSSKIIDKLYFYWYQSPELGPKIYEYIDFLIEKGKNIREREPSIIIERTIGTSLKDDPFASLNLEYFLSLLRRGIIKADEKIVYERRRPPISIYEYALEKYKKDSFELLNGLYEYGFNINAQNEKGQTPLILAIEKLKLDDVMFLIHEGDSLNIKDSLGRTPLMYMLKQKFGMLEHWPETRDILFSTIVNPSVDIFATDNDGNNVLDYLLKDNLLHNIYGQDRLKLPAWRKDVVEHILRVLPKETLDALIKPEHIQLSRDLAIYALEETPLPTNIAGLIGNYMAGSKKGGRRRKTQRRRRQMKRKTRASKK